MDSDAGWTNAAANGVRIRLGWTQIEPTEGHYDWSLIDAAVIKAQSTGKVLGVSIVALADPPDWLIALGAKTWPLPPTGSGHQRDIVLPWDPIVQSHWIALTKAFGARFDGKIDYVAMGGLGAVIESYICPDASTINMTLPAAITAWTGSSNAIIDAHAEAFKSTTFIFTAAKPFQDPAAEDALSLVVRAAAAKYPKRMGVMNCSLNAHSTTGYTPSKLVSDLSGTNPNGLQFLCSSVGFGGHDLGGTLKEALDCGVALKAHFLEVYAYDLDKPENAQLLKDTAAKLPK